MKIVYYNKKGDRNKKTMAVVETFSVIIKTQRGAHKKTTIYKTDLKRSTVEHDTSLLA